MAAHPVAVRLLQLLSSFLVGIALVVGPWTSLWEQHPLLAVSPAFREMALAAWLRGSVTGLGLVNLAAAAWDAFEIFRPRGRP